MTKLGKGAAGPQSSPNYGDGTASGGTDPGDDLTGAIALLDKGAPLVLCDGIVSTDGGHVILTQYVDVGAEIRTRRPSVLVKAIESQYGIEHAADVQLSAPRRFRDYGETLIRDDQEGYARRETRTESTTRPPEESHREQERALRLLGAENITVSGTGKRLWDTNTESVTFGKSAWIYCTSVEPQAGQREAWDLSLPRKYDHESKIRQPRRFALALGEMFADQHGPEGNRNDLKHGTTVRSFQDSQVVLHGPVWYTNDVLGFLRDHKSDPLYYLYALFVKDTEYREQREYRFVVHCESPVENETLLLRISRNMRGALVPRGVVGSVTFERADSVETEEPSKPTTTQTPGSRTMARTRRETENRSWSTRINGKVATEGVATRERVFTVTTELPADSVPQDCEGAAVSGPGKGVATESEKGEHKVAGEVVDAHESVRTKVFYLEDASDADSAFTLEARDDAAALLEAAGRPFDVLGGLPQRATEALKALAREAMELDRDVEVQAMSACWNAIWAVCNIHKCFGDVVESVGIEGSEFVAIGLNGSSRPGAEAKILVGPRGTFAYVLTVGEERRRGHGGTEGRLVFFPDDETRATFEEFGWMLRSEDEEAA